MNHDHHPERDAVPTSADLAPTDGLLAAYKRASLSRQALHAAWLLGALARRIEHEAPRAHRPLRDAVAALLLLGDQLALRQAGDRAPQPTVGAEATSETWPAGLPRQGELF